MMCLLYVNGLESRRQLMSCGCPKCRWRAAGPMAEAAEGAEHADALNPASPAPPLQEQRQQLNPALERALGSGASLIPRRAAGPSLANVFEPAPPSLCSTIHNPGEFSPANSQLFTPQPPEQRPPSADPAPTPSSRSHTPPTGAREVTWTSWIAHAFVPRRSRLTATSNDTPRTSFEVSGADGHQRPASLDVHWATSLEGKGATDMQAPGITLNTLRSYKNSEVGQGKAEGGSLAYTSVQAADLTP
jgi:hypothetical protein